MKQWKKPELKDLNIEKTKEDGTQPALLSHIYCNYCDFKTNDCSGIMSHLYSNAGEGKHPHQPNETDYTIDTSIANTVCQVIS